MNTDLSKRSQRLFALIGAGAMATAATLSYLGVQDSHPGSTYFSATFGQSAQGLDPESAIKVRGINVGTVSSVKLTSNGQVRVRIRLDKGVQVPETAALSIEPLSVFGPKFIDLKPGAGEGSGPYLADGASIAKTQGLQDLTDAVTPIYDLLGAISAQDVATLLYTLSAGLDGRGQGLAETIDDGGKLLDLSTKNIHNLRTLLDNTAAISETLGSRGDEIVKLAHALNVVAPTLSDDPAAFRSILTGTSAVSSQVVALLDADPKGPGAIIRSVVPVVDASYRTRANTPAFLEGVGSFFSQFAGIIQVPGPHGTFLATETVHVYLNDPICTFILGLCSPYPKPLPLPALGGN
jgi:phospholipid/cholesterol/gamma-HCH transport system substrate-binding protein